MNVRRGMFFVKCEERAMFRCVIVFSNHCTKKQLSSMYAITYYEYVRDQCIKKNSMHTIID